MTPDGKRLCVGYAEVSPGQKCTRVGTFARGSKERVVMDKLERVVNFLNVSGSACFSLCVCRRGSISPQISARQMLRCEKTN